MRRLFGRRDFLASVAAATISATACSGSILDEAAASVGGDDKSAAGALLAATGALLAAAGALLVTTSALLAAIGSWLTLVTWPMAAGSH